MRNTAGPGGIPRVSLHFMVAILAGFIPLYSLTPLSSVLPTSNEVHAATPITPSGLNTQVNLSATPPAGHVQYDITGGTRPGGGTNLFHSFGDFNVPTNNIANFLNDSGLPTSNILGRVTGGNSSNIFGTIQTTGFGNANLFLMNPYGFLFGANATLNVGGMVTFTTADYLRLSNGTNNGYFYADPAGPSLLTAAPVAAFGFLGPNAASIAIQGGTLEVPEGKTLSFIGGPRSFTTDTGATVPSGVTMTGGSLSAPNGLIYMATVTSPGEIPVPTLSGAPLGTLGPSSSDPTVIRIRSGEFVIDHAFLTATNTSDAAQSAIEVNVQGTITLRNASAISTETFGAGHGSDVHIAAQSLQMDGSSIKSTTTGDGGGSDISITNVQTVNLTNGAQIVSSTEGLGAGGNITIAATDSVSISGFDTTGTISGTTAPFMVDPSTGLALLPSGVFSTTSGPATTATGGAIAVTAPTITVENAGHIVSITSGDGPGGNITLSGTNVSVAGAGQVLSSAGFDPTFGFNGNGKAGDISVTAQDTLLVSGGNPQFFSASTIQVASQNGSAMGNITLSAPNGNIRLEDGGQVSSFESFGGGGPVGSPGSITVNTNNLSITGALDLGIGFDLPSSIQITSFVPGADLSQPRGAVNVSASSVNIDRGEIRSSILGDGHGADITLNVGTLNITGGGAVAAGADSSNLGSPSQSGTVTVNATDTISITGTNPNDPGIRSRIENVAGGSDTTLAGDIMLTTKRLVVADQGRISFETTGLTQGNGITIDASESVTIGSGGKVVMSSSFGEGTIPGVIDITSPVVSLSDGGAFQTSTAGGGAAGPVNIHTGTLTLSNHSFITSESTQGIGAGGPITIDATDSIIISGGSTISSSTQLLDAPAGSIAITAGNLVSLSGSGTGLLSQTSGAGSGGTITVQTPQVQIMDGAVISAKSSGSGAAGSVVIEGTQSPAQSTLIDGAGSGIFTETQGTGAGGNIFVNANSVTLQNGGTLSAATSGTADSATGGTITIAATDVQLSNGALITAQTTGAGNAGNILVKADSVSITGVAQITSSSVIGASGDIPTGNAGNVTIQGLASPAESVLISGIDENFNSSGIFTDTQGTGAGGNIFVNANSVTLQNGAGISAQTTGAGNAGAITIAAEESVSLLSGSFITSSSFVGGNGGPVTITAPTVSLQDSSISTLVLGFGSDLSTAGAGAVTITASKSLSLVNFRIDSSSFDTAGNAGQISLTSPIVSLSNQSTISSEALNSSFNPDGSPVGLPTDGNGGSVELAVGQLVLADSSIITTQTTGGGQGGNVIVHGLAGPGSQAADVTITSGAGILTNTTDLGAAGHITVDTARLTVSGGGQMQAATIGPGSGGTITIRATEQVSISGAALVCPTCPAGQRTRPSQLITTSTPPPFGPPSTATGNAGEINLTTPSLVVQDGGVISTATTTRGNASTVTLNVDTMQLLDGGHVTGSSVFLPIRGEIPAGNAGNVTVHGQAGPGSRATSVLIDGPGSGIFTDTQGTGAGGNILVNANSVTLQNGGTLSAKTSGTALSATGGTITVDANQMQLNSGATITANSTGAADAGSINITATNGLTMQQNSSITTEVTPSGTGSSAGGGNIKITTSPEATVWLQNSKISASVADGPGGGGNISIDPQFVILQNSQILAQAAQGQGGAITITAGLFLPDATSVVSADSGSGVNGTVTIQSPNAPASGQIQPLGKSPLLATSLLNQRCASLAGGEFSSFTVAGRDSLPTEPGSWLASPLALGQAGFNPGAVAEAGAQARVIDDPAHETTVLSLRQIAPAGFLSQAYAVDWSAGCPS